MKSYKLYTVEGIDYDAVINKYRQICKNGISDIDSDSISVYSNTELKYKVIHKSRKPIDSDYKILFKAQFIIHTIAYRQATSSEDIADGVTILSDILRDAVGNDYYELTKALEELGYIKVLPIYKIGKQSKKYKVLGNIVVIKSGYNKTVEYIKETKERLLRDTQDKVDSRYNVKFRKTYTKNLRKFKIKDKVGFNKFIDRKRKPAKIHYYNFIRECFNDKLNIISIDYNNRIYQVLTSMKRELKQYLNIKFSIDCKNSHPLLFNYFIFNSKNISTDLSYKISFILSSLSYRDNIEYHYVVKNLRNELINNGIDGFIVEIFTDDELLYLWKTTTGRFWDDIVKENEHKYQRTVIKKRMFAQVFYSKTEKDAMFATQFKRDYPNVYELILRWKTPLQYKNLSKSLVEHKKAVECDGVVRGVEQETALPNLMMTLESELFYLILTRLYSNNISAVHIHDAIVIPDTETDVEVSQIEEVMREVYKQYGLHPMFSVDVYAGDKLIKNNKTVLFDFDDTLFDTTPTKSLRSVKTKDWESIYEQIPNCRLYEGFNNVFDFIRTNNINVGIVSIAQKELINRTVKHFNCPCNHIQGWWRLPMKPYPNQIYKALEKLKVDTKDVIMFGDSPDDVEACRAAGIKIVGCTWGLQNKEEINVLINSNPDYIIHNPIEIINILQHI